MGIKTIHIRNDDILKLKALAKELFDHTLKDDPKFHFFFEPDLIFRITTEDCLAKVKSLLETNNIEFKEYDYPFPTKKGEFGEECDGIVANNLELFLQVFHANSVAALTMSEEEHFKYLERLVHTAFNPKYYSHEQEGKWLLKLAALKLGIQITLEKK